MFYTHTHTHTPHTWQMPQTQHFPPTRCDHTQLYERFRPGQPVPKELGPNRDWNVDLVPKFMMANGKLVRACVRVCVCV